MQQVESPSSSASVVSGVGRFRVLRLDHGLALAVLASAVAFAAEGSGLGGGAQWPVAVFVVVVANTAVGLRRVRPLEAVLVVAVCVVAAPAPGLLVGAALVSVYSAAARFGRRDTAVAALSLAVAFVVERAAWGFADDVLPPLFLAVVAAGAVGLYVGVRRVSAVERQRYVREQQTLVEERSAAEERVRIARELHDVVAHTLSLIVVQSEVLSTRTADEEVRAGAVGVAELGRAAMGELHRTLDLLRGDEPAEWGPQPGLADLSRLVEQTREGGTVVELSVVGTLRPLPAGVEVSAFRIVQEALTNVRRHAGAAASARVVVRYGLEALEVSIENVGAVGESSSSGEGHGLRGMRERAAMLGGALSAGPLGGGYRVSAILPYSEERP